MIIGIECWLSEYCARTDIDRFWNIIFSFNSIVIHVLLSVLFTFWIQFELGAIVLQFVAKERAFWNILNIHATHFIIQYSIVFDLRYGFICNPYANPIV